MSTTISSNNAVTTTQVAEVKSEKPTKPAKDATITWNEWWNGEKSLTSTGVRYIGADGLADWLDDDDKICTDGKDDGKLSFKEGATSFLAGLVGGIPKAIINHPLATAATVAVAGAAMAFTGGAAAPILLGLGGLFTAGSMGASIYGAVTADTDAEAKMALDVGKIFYAERDIVAYGNLGIGRLIYQLPMPLCKMFIKEIFDGKSPDDFDEETLTTINKFFENSLNVSETSRQLYIHRNTLVYRLDKLQKSTNLDLRVFEDAITFKIALMVVKYMKYMESLEY